MLDLLRRNMAPPASRIDWIEVHGLAVKRQETPK